MKRLVPLVIVLAIAGSIGMNCRCDHAIGPNDKFVCLNDDAKKDVHQLKYKRDKNGNVTAGVDGTCPAPCTGNSPIVNSFPINGLDVAGAGACNPEHVRVDPGKAGKPNKCSNGDLKFMSTTGTLVVKNLKGDTCAGSDLEGASFDVESAGGKVTLTIKKVVQIPYGDKPLEGSDTREGYLIVASVPGTSSQDDVSVCNSVRAGEVRKAIGLKPTIGDFGGHVGSGSGSDVPEKWADYVIAVPGPLYSNFVKQISYGSNFYNLACATDALAKRTLARVTKPSDDPSKQYAALRMLTATYCSKPRTKKGMRLHWEGVSTGSGTGSGEALESSWNVEGAECLEHLRLEQMDSDFMNVFLGSDVIPSACGGNYGHDNCKDWKMFADAVRAECKVAGTDDDPKDLWASCTGSGSGSGSNAAGIPASGSATDYWSYAPAGSGSSGSASYQQAQTDHAHAGTH